MMTYTYYCPIHGTFTVSQKITETTATHACPICNKESRKVLQPTVTVFKGYGWTPKRLRRK